MFSYLDIMMESLMQLPIGIHPIIHRLSRSETEVFLGDDRQSSHGGLWQDRSEGELVDYMRQVGHRRIDIVMLRSHFNVEITRNTKKKEKKKEQKTKENG
jgi:hypothetical protein